MPSKPARSKIRPRVIHSISVVSGVLESDIVEADKLKDDLQMGKEARGVLAPSFQGIARETNPDAVIRRVECKALETVKAAVDLVWGRS